MVFMQCSMFFLALSDGIYKDLSDWRVSAVTHMHTSLFSDYDIYSIQ